MTLLENAPVPGHGANPHASAAENTKNIEVARAGALALWSLSRSNKNKHAMQRAGVIPLLAKLLKSSNENMLIPVAGIIEECATDVKIQSSSKTNAFIPLLFSPSIERPFEE